MVVLSSTVQAQETGLVRIKVDVDSVALIVDGDSVYTDSYGSALLKDVWFILSLPVGDHSLEFYHPPHDPITRSATLGGDEVVTHEIFFEPIDSAAFIVSLMVSSDPDTSAIYLDGQNTGLFTPALVSVDTGQHRLEVRKEGFESFLETLKVGVGQKGSINFILRTVPPDSVTINSLGLEYLPMTPMMNPELADRLWETYRGLSETFLIVPLGQGILAKILAAGDSESETNALIGAGVVLTVGSYLIGKTLSKRKRLQIETANEEAKLANEIAKIENNDADRIVREENDTAVQLWEEENKGRGKTRKSIH